MDRSIAEVLILAINAIGAGMLMFIGGVIQPIMNGMDAASFRQFLNSLDRAAMSDPFAVTIATLPIVAAVLYFTAYGFRHWWFTAGFAVWLAGSTMTKIVNMPIYNWVGDPRNTDPEQLERKRRRLQAGNRARAWLTLASVALMACQFDPRAVAALSAAISLPLLWLARRYLPN